MKQYEGNIMAYLNSETKADIEKHEHYEIQFISAYDIEPNKDNFYGIRDIEKLAADMEKSNHITPLEVVKKEDGKYLLISGERRRAAVILRYEAGEIPNADLPCYIRTDIAANDKFTLEQMMKINLITANSYRAKTPFEVLDEVLTLEPMARIEYDIENQKEGEKLFKDFREFFAKKFLGIPPTNLQRILCLKKLVPEARTIYNEHKIPSTALSELAYKKEDVQREILDQIAKGEIRGSLQEIKGYKSEEIETKLDENDNQGVNVNDNTEITTDSNISENSDNNQNQVNESYNNNENNENNGNEVNDNSGEETSENIDTNSEDEDSSNDNSEYDFYKSNSEKSDTNIEGNTSPKSKKMLSPEEVQEEAYTWVIQGIQRMIEEAEKMKKNEEINGNTLEAAKWDSRRAAANVVLETIK